MRKISKEDEARLHKVAAALADIDGDPNPTLLKLAKQYNLTPGEIELCATTYNQGTQSVQQKESRGASRKYASFPLADHEHVLAQLYKPDKTAAAKSPTPSREYDAPPRFRETTGSVPRPAFLKVAEAAPPKPADSKLTVTDRYQLRKRAVENTRQAVHTLNIEIGAKLAEYHAYLDRPRHARLSLPAIVEAFETYGGEKMACFVADAKSRPRYAAEVAERGRSKVAEAIDWNRAPFSTAATCLELGELMPEVELAHKQASDALANDKVSAMLSGRKEAGTEPERFLGRRKDAFIDQLTTSALAHAMGGMPRQPQNIVSSNVASMLSPEHEASLRRIGAQAMLNSIMSDEDDPISGHDPDKVITAYNEIAQAMPSAALSPGVIRPFLARRLVGDVQPFEAKEMADVNRSLTVPSPRPMDGING